MTVSFFLVIESLLGLCHVESTSVRRDPYVEFASNAPLFVPQTQTDGAFLQTAADKRSFFNTQRFAKHKSEDVIRVFCLGGSTTFGRPYDDRTSFVGWLREFLRVADREQQWEVINAGGISYASYRVAALMEELCDYSPDVFIVYTGHNEFLEERTYRELSSVHRLNAILRKTRTYSLAYDLLHHERSESGRRQLMSAEVDTILDHASGPGSYHRDDQLRAAILEHFEFNLARMIRIARAAGAEILFVIPAANLKDFSPFKSEHRRDLDEIRRRQWSESIAQAIELEERGQPSEALAALMTAADIDDRRADLHFRTGRLLFAQGRFSEARTAFLRAIDEDVCPLRSLPAIEGIVTRTARSRDVPLVDFDDLLQRDCRRRFGHDSPGKEYFLDHVHPTIATHGLLAAAIVEAMRQRGLVAIGESWPEKTVATVSSRITSRVDPELRSRALTNLAQVLSWAGKQVEAGPFALQAVRMRSEQGLAADPEGLFYAAVHLAMVGSDQRAMELFEQVLELEPDHLDARWRLATLLHDQAKYDEAGQHFLEAVRLNPADAYSYHMLGGISLRSRNYDQAHRFLRRAIELAPDDAAISVDIAFTCEQLGRVEEAIDCYQRAIHLGVGATRVHERLRELRLKRAESAGGVPDHSNDVRTTPANAWR